MTLPSVVFTDLDGTLLSGGRLPPAARRAVLALRSRGIPVVPLTSKTEAELRTWLTELDAGGFGAFENGAGVVTPTGVEILPGAVPVAELRKILGAARRAAGVDALTLDEMPDEMLASVAGLDAEARRAARDRAWDLPFRADAPAVEALGKALAGFPDTDLVAGGVFWHLTGRHDKGGAARFLLQRLGAPGPTAGLGDAPNDAPFLAAVDVAVIVPGPRGADPRLIGALPGALVASAPGGEGWARAVEALLAGPMPDPSGAGTVA